MRWMLSKQRSLRGHGTEEFLPERHYSLSADRTMQRKLPDEPTAAAAANASDQIDVCVVDGRQFARVCVDGKVLLLPPRCPHRGAPMSESHVVGNFIVCGRHGATFDLRTGMWVRGPSCRDIHIVLPDTENADSDTAASQ